VLRQLHWLPVRQRVDFKIVMLVHRSLSGHIPSYLADDCRLVTDVRARRLSSADTRTLAVGRTQSTFSDRTFTAAAPRLWNSLPPDLRQPGLRDCHMDNLGVHWRHFYLGSRATGAVWPLLTAL